MGRQADKTSPRYDETGVPWLILADLRVRVARARPGKGGRLLLTPAFLALTAAVISGCAPAHCASTAANEIVAENCKPGSPASEWDVEGAGDPSIQGFAADISVDQGATVQFKVKTVATDYRLDIYRMGYYTHAGARKVATVEPTAALPQAQPDCLREDASGLVDCGNWGVSASWAVPADAVSGVYFAKLVREDVAGGGSHVMFVVRDDDGASDLLV